MQKKSKTSYNRSSVKAGLTSTSAKRKDLTYGVSIKYIIIVVLLYSMPKLMRTLIAAVVFLLISQTTAAQLPVLHWAKAFKVPPGSYLTTNSNGRTLGTDAQGNVYSAGLFQETLDFDPGPGIYNLNVTGYSAIYISKLDAEGNFMWAKRIPTVVSFGDIELKVTSDGTVYLASNLSEPADMDPGPGSYVLTPIGPRDAFVIKLDTNGNLVWAKQFGGTGDTVPEANTLEIDLEQNVIICGLFNNTVDFNPGPGTNNLTSSAHMQVFIVKLNSDGNFIWVKQFGNSPNIYSGSQIKDIKCDAAGNIFTVGGFKGNCDFDPGPGNYNLTGGTFQDCFISKLDKNGNFVWAKGLHGNYYSHHMQTRAIDVDEVGSVIVVGSFNGSFDLNPGSGVSTVTASPYDCYILKLDGLGNFIWARTIGGSDSDGGNDLEIDVNNNVYFIGSFGPTVDFDPGPGTFIINSTGYGAAALVKLNSAGEFIYAATFPGSGSSIFRRMWLDGIQNVYISGNLTGTVDFDPSPNSYMLTGSSNSSPFVVKLAPCNNMTTSNLYINSCTSYTLNSQTFDTTGRYQQVIPNSTGCDSIITLHLTINKKRTEQKKEICDGSFYFAGGGNQTTFGTYIDTLKTTGGCDSIVTTFLDVRPRPLPALGADKNLCNNSIITITPGSFNTYLWQDSSTMSSFTINTAGLYWVRVTNQFHCSASDTFIVKSLLPLPTNFLTGKDSICAYDKLELYSANVYPFYQWSTGSIQKKIIIQSPGLYWLKVTDVNGCINTDSLTVYQQQCMSGIYLPSAFTPNRDGKNDFFRASVFGKTVSFKLQVFERGGQLIFETSDPNKYWDGRIKGKDYPTGVLVWQCFYQLEGQQPDFQKGTVLIIR